MGRDFPLPSISLSFPSLYRKSFAAFQQKGYLIKAFPASGGNFLILWDEKGGMRVRSCAGCLCVV